MSISVMLWGETAGDSSPGGRPLRRVGVASPLPAAATFRLCMGLAVWRRQAEVNLVHLMLQGWHL